MPTTTTITLDRNEQRDTLYTVQGRTFWQDYGGTEFREVLRVGGLTTRYTDADDRPGRTDHDGNGWTDRVREYTINAVPEALLKPALEDVRDTRGALGDVDRRFLEALSAPERAAFTAAHLARYRGHRDGRDVRVFRGGEAGWRAVEMREGLDVRPLPGTLHLMVRQGDGWRDDHTGELFHREGRDWVPGSGADEELEYL